MAERSYSSIMRRTKAVLIIDWKNNFNNDDKLVPALPNEGQVLSTTAGWLEVTADNLAGHLGLRGKTPIGWLTGRVAPFPLKRRKSATICDLPIHNY
jgi:hypothetical protein